MEDAWKIVIWSLLACFLGEHPTEAWASDADVDLSRGGMYLAGGFFLVIWSLKADLEAWYKGLFLRHQNSNEFCEFCPAHSSMADDDEPMPWNNFKAGALCGKKTSMDSRTMEGEMYDIALVVHCFSFSQSAQLGSG